MLMIKQIENYLSKNNISLKGLNRETKENRVKDNEVIELLATYDTKTTRKNKIIATISSFDNVSGVYEE